MDLIPLFQHTAEQQPHSAGSVIFQAADVGQVMYVILHGLVDIERDGRLVCTAGPGDFFGEMALIADQPRSATAVARSDCLLALVSPQRFRLLVGQAPDFSLHVMRVLAERLGDTATAA